MDALLARRREDVDGFFGAAEPERLTRELLPGWDDEWVLLARSRHHDLSWHALDTYIREHIERGNLSEARRAIKVALDADPLHEPAVRTLMEIHRAAGDRDEAIRTYFRFRDRWFDEFGLEPHELEAIPGWLGTRDWQTLKKLERGPKP